MNTLEQMRQFCVVDADDPDSCWLFKAKTAHRPVEGHAKQRRTTPQRAAWDLAHRKKAAPGTYIVPRCGDLRCVNPDHLDEVTRAQYGRIKAQSGVLKNSPARIAAARNRWRNNTSLTAGQVQEILVSDRPGKELAEQLGVSPSYISRVRRGGAAKTLMTQINPFAALLR